MATTAGSGSSSNDVLRSERIAGVIPGAGSAAYIYWILGFITFVVPGAIVTGQLGLMFPGEGSICVWTHKAFGAFMGFFAGFCAWWPGVLVMIATGDTVVSLIQQLNSNFLSEPWQQGVVIIAVIAFSFVLSILRFRVTQNIVNVVFVAYGGAILLVGLAGLLSLGHPAPVDYSPHAWSLNWTNATFSRTVIPALLGIEVAFNMRVELTHPRSITRYLLWVSVDVIAALLIGMFGVMVAVPLKDQGSPAAIAEAVQLGFGSAGTYLGLLVNFIFI